MKCVGLVGMVVLVMTAGCGTDSARPPTPPGNTGESANATPAKPKDATTNEQSAKPAAPVNMTAKLRSGGADVDIVFAADATNVAIKVWGVDGLTVTKGATPVSGAAVRNGQAMTVSVDYDAPATESNLAVSVTGVFGGREQAKVQSFTINAGAPSAAAPMGETKVDKDGQRVKVMKQE